MPQDRGGEDWYHLSIGPNITLPDMNGVLRYHLCARAEGWRWLDRHWR
jgi:hypothetical protein